MDEYIVSFQVSIENRKQYEVTIGNFVACTYIHFVSMLQAHWMVVESECIVNIYITSYKL